MREEGFSESATPDTSGGDRKKQTVALFEKLKSTDMSSDQAHEIANKIRHEIDTGIIQYDDLGVDESGFNEVVSNAARSAIDLANHVSASRYG